MSANRFKYKVWINEDIDGAFGETEQGMLRKGWLKDQCDWFQLSPNGQELMWGRDDCEEPLVVGRDVSVLFSTGLKDQLGKEIFEGDIIEYPTVSGIKIHHPVIWIQKRCCFMPITLSGEVIGNIYENPELIEESPCQK